jgi:P27 family predicted phage terminase small subunit
MNADDVIGRHPHTIPIDNDKRTVTKVTVDIPLELQGAPECPEWLDENARKIWLDIVPKLEQLNLITKLDSALLTAYCLAIVDLKNARMILHVEGMLHRVKGKHAKLTKHPAYDIQAQALRTIKTISEMFGFDPHTRFRSLPIQQTKEKLETGTKLIDKREIPLDETPVNPITKLFG